MCFLGFTVSSSSAELENKTKKNHSCQTLVVFFSSKFKKVFWDVEHFWMTSTVLSEAALLWSTYVLSVASVSPWRIHSNFVRLLQLWLNLFRLSLCHLFFSSLLPLHPITLCSLPSSYAGILIFHNSPLLLQCLHLLFIVISAECKIINWYNSLKWNCFF